MKKLIEKIEKLSKVQRIIIAVIIPVLMICLTGYFSFYKQWDVIQKLEKEVKVLKKEKKELEETASKLQKYREAKKKLEVKFSEAKKSLPETEEIPSLLTSISHSGQDSGLEFLLFQPQKEQNDDLHAELPIAIEVTGTYHDMALFFDKVSRLNRIVNIRDIKMGVVGKDSNQLNIKCTAVTYKFLEATPDEETDTKKRGRRK